MSLALWGVLTLGSSFLRVLQRDIRELDTNSAAGNGWESIHKLSFHSYKTRVLLPNIYCWVFEGSTQGGLYWKKRALGGMPQKKTREVAGILPAVSY